MRTAEKIIEQLHSRGRATNEKALAALGEYSNALPATGKLTRAKETFDLVVKVTRDSYTNPVCETRFMFNPKIQVPYFQTPYGITVNPTIIREVKDMLKVKKSKNL